MRSGVRSRCVKCVLPVLDAPPVLALEVAPATAGAVVVVVGPAPDMVNTHLW